MVLAYSEQQKKLFLRLDKKLSLMQDKCKLMAYFKGISNKDFCDRYTKRYNSLLTHKETLSGFYEDYREQKLLKQKELDEAAEQEQTEEVRQQVETISEALRSNEERMFQMEQLLNILNESTATFTNRLFNEDQETR